MDVFDAKNISPMLLGERKEPFDNEDYIYELKLDGMRCLIYLGENSTVIKNRKNRDITLTFPELSDLHKAVTEKCILDGELVFTRDGKPDFFALQSRSFMTDHFKIKLKAKSSSISFVAFDIVYYKDKMITSLPLMDRKQILQNTVKENERISVSRFISTRGVEFFRLAKQQGLEGIVAKRKDSKYLCGKRSNDWLKIKVMFEEDFIICGYRLKNGEVKELVLCKYDNTSTLVLQKIIAFNLSREIESKLKEASKSAPLFDIKNIEWIELKLVCTVSYLEITKNGSMRQPFFKGLRDDVDVTECRI